MDLTHVRFQGVPAPLASIRPRQSSRTLRSTDQLDRPAATGLPWWVLERAGLDPRLYRCAPLERRIAACLRALHVDTEDAAREAIQHDPARLSLALNVLLIGLSGFFRDPPVFGLIASSVVPALRDRPGPLRVWSVGCSNGAELYSVAMLLAEADLLDRTILLGTDCRDDAIEAARAGRFGADALATVPAGLVARYFDRTRAGGQISSTIARHIAWHVSDATRSIEDGPWDLVLCRNLVIYVQNDVASLLLRRIAATLSPGGFLVVGKAERPPAACGLSAIGRSVHRRHAD
jgi:chemotaxis protein methyltransferase CheR